MGRPQSAAPLWGRASLKGGSGPGRCGKNGFLLASRTKGVVGRRGPLREQKPQRVGLTSPPSSPLLLRAGALCSSLLNRGTEKCVGVLFPIFLCAGGRGGKGTGAGRAAGRGALIRLRRPGRGDFQRESAA